MSPQFKPQTNRRQSPRAPITMAVKERVGDCIKLCQSNDISVDGIFLASATDEDRRRGQKCWLEFSLPGSQRTIVARGEVVRQDYYRDFNLTAVRFASIAPSHQRMIQAYLEGPHQATRLPLFLPHPSGATAA